MVIKGTVVDIIYRNPQNNYSIISIDCSGELITAVGVLPEIFEGENLSITGEYRQNVKYGKQYHVTSSVQTPPTNEESIMRYLTSGLFKGIGEVTAMSIVNMYGDKALEILEFTPNKVAKVKGVSVKRANEWSEAYRQNKQRQVTIMYLQKYNISMNMALKIYKVYGAETENILSSNPYKLVEDVDGIGFLTADSIASSMGISKVSDFRVQSGLIYTLNGAVTKSGNSCLPEENLINDATAILGVDRDLVVDALDNIIIRDIVKSYKSGDINLIALNKFYFMEQSIARRLVQIRNESDIVYADLDRDIEEFERIFNIVLHHNQKEAIKNAISNGLSVITGGPGTGKTTIIKAIIFVLKNRKQRIVLTAPTGRAAKRLNEATGSIAKTIHRVLGLDFKNKSEPFMFNSNNKLPADIIIIDEVSMVDIYIFHSLLNAISHGSRLILIGDKDQLPSVGAGNILADIITSKQFHISYLTHIYRQAEESLIVINAHKVNAGEMPILEDMTKDFFFNDKAEATDIKDTVISMCTTRLPKFLNIDPMDIQVLCPMKKGIAGTNNLNIELRNSINPKSQFKKEIVCGEVFYREGDKVMQSSNNYQINWVVDDGVIADSGTGVFNGELGNVQSIDNVNRSMTIRFEDGKKATYSESEFDQLILAYAISIHKSQGSEFPVIIICIGSGSYFLININLLYTAITRAKEAVVIVGSKKNLYHMVNNSYVQERYTLLPYFLGEYII